MRSLAAAVYAKLSQMHGATEVYHGLAQEPVMPYICFGLGASMRRQYASNEGIYGVLYVVPVYVHVYANGATAAGYVGDKVEEIIETFENGLEVSRHTAVRVDTVSHICEIDPEQDTPGDNIWHGLVTFEVTLSRNTGESSSTSSTASSVSASTQTASVSSASSSESSLSSASSNSSSSGSSASGV